MNWYKFIKSQWNNYLNDGFLLWGTSRKALEDSYRSGYLGFSGTSNNLIKKYEVHLTYDQNEAIMLSWKKAKEDNSQPVLVRLDCDADGEYVSTKCISKVLTIGRTDKVTDEQIDKFIPSVA